MSTNARHLPHVRPNAMSARGWTDYRAGLAFPREYEGWSEIDQRHYERGRLRAAGAPMRYRKVPACEPSDINERLRGLRVVPPKAERRG
jgi:hypothetical protein